MGNWGIVWVVAGLLALLSLGQTLRVTVETRTGVNVYGLPSGLCREVAATGKMSVTEAAQVYSACRYEAGVGSEALCAKVVRGTLSVGEATQLYRAYPQMSEWEWKRLCPMSASHMLKPTCRHWDWKAILSGRVLPGMTDDQVLVAWGFPTIVRRTSNVGEVREVWVYQSSRMVGTRYLHFRNGALIAIETRCS